MFHVGIEVGTRSYIVNNSNWLKDMLKFKSGFIT